MEVVTTWDTQQLELGREKYVQLQSFFDTSVIKQEKGEPGNEPIYTNYMSSTMLSDIVTLLGSSLSIMELKNDCK